MDYETYHESIVKDVLSWCYTCSWGSRKCLRAGSLEQDFLGSNPSTTTCYLCSLETFLPQFLHWICEMGRMIVILGISISEIWINDFPWTPQCLAPIKHPRSLSYYLLIFNCAYPYLFQHRFSYKKSILKIYCNYSTQPLPVFPQLICAAE